MSTKSQSGNDQRSNTKNPNSAAYWSDRANRVQQGHEVPAAPPQANPQPPAPEKKG
jgi:hypothetical protein